MAAFAFEHVKATRQHFVVPTGAKSLYEILDQVRGLVAAYYAEYAGSKGYEALLPSESEEEEDYDDEIDDVPVALA